MNFFKETVISIADTVLITIGAFALMFSVTFILFLFGVDIFDIKGSCTYSFTENGRWFCKMKDNNLFLGFLGLFILTFWYFFIKVFKRHNNNYQKIK